MQRNELVILFGQIYSHICIGYISVLLFPSVLLCFSFVNWDEIECYLFGGKVCKLISLYRDSFYPDLEIQVEPERDREVSFLFLSIFSFPWFSMVWRVMSIL